MDTNLIFQLTDVLRLPFGPPSSGRPQILDPVLALQSFRSARVQYGANKLKMSLWEIRDG